MKNWLKITKGKIFYKGKVLSYEFQLFKIKSCNLDKCCYCKNNFFRSHFGIYRYYFQFWKVKFNDINFSVEFQKRCQAKRFVEYISQYILNIDNDFYIKELYFILRDTSQDTKLLIQKLLNLNKLINFI